MSSSSARILLVGSLLVAGAAVAALVLAPVRAADDAPPAYWWVPRLHPGNNFEPRGQVLRPRDRSVIIQIDARDCWLADRSPVDRIDVEETDATVTITAYVERSNGEAACLSAEFERVRLSAPLGDRTLLVGGGEEVVEAEIMVDDPPMEIRPEPFRSENET